MNATYIDKPELIPVLLELGWIVAGSYWTDCPQRIYCTLTEDSINETIN